MAGWSLVMKINNIIKLSFIRLKLCFYKLKSSFFMIALVIVVISLFAIWWKYSENSKPTVLIANEENSVIATLTISSVLNNKVAEIVNFETTDYEEGKKRIEKGEAILLLYIKKGTINTLYEGNKAELYLYTKNVNNDFTRLVISYINGFTDIINISQNAGLAYMGVLYEKGMTENQRIEKFNELQSSYVKLTLARNNIFTGDNKVLGLDSKDFKTGYWLFIAIFLISISLRMILKSEILRKNMRERLILSGFSEMELYLSVILGIVATSLAFSFIFVNLAKVLGIGD